jgi:hypothetical protein
MPLTLRLTDVLSPGALLALVRRRGRAETAFMDSVLRQPRLRRRSQSTDS